MLVVVSAPAVTSADEILLGTGETGSFSHFVGRAVCRTIQRSTGQLNCLAIPAQDSIHTLTNIQEGSLDLALCSSNLLYDAAHRSGHFKFMDIRYDNLGSLLPLYPIPILMLARSDAKIHTLAQAKGKRINAGAPRSKEQQVLEMIMTVKGWMRKDFRVFQELPSALGQDTLAFCHGAVDVMMHIGVHPDSALQHVMSLCRAVPVAMDDADIVRLLEMRPDFSKLRIPSSTYPDMENPVATFGTTMILVASLNLDDATIGTVMTALEKNQAHLQRLHPALTGFSMKRPEAKGLGISLHPGADAYLSAQGR